jgi:hypothetical protein
MARRGFAAVLVAGLGAVRVMPHAICAIAMSNKSKSYAKLTNYCINMGKMSRNQKQPLHYGNFAVCRRHVQTTPYPDRPTPTHSRLTSAAA